MHSIGQQAGQALRRAPYAWLIATLAVLVVTMPPLSILAKDSNDASTGLTIGAMALVAYSVITALLLAPRLIYPKANSKQPDNDVAFLRWSFAMAPFIIGYGAVAAGAQLWSLSVGFISSVVLLVAAAETIRRSSRG